MNVRRCQIKEIHTEKGCCERDYPGLRCRPTKYTELAMWSGMKPQLTRLKENRPSQNERHGRPVMVDSRLAADSTLVPLPEVNALQRSSVPVQIEGAAERRGPTVAPDTIGVIGRGKVGGWV